MKILKKLLIGLGILIVLLLAAAIILPIIFKDDIVAVVKEQANENLNATVDFSDVSLSLFRNFPNVSVGLEDLSVTGKEDFEGVKLIHAKRFDLVLDLFSVIGGGNPLKLKGISLDKPDVNVIVLENGKANYDIAKPSETPEKPATQDTSGFEIKLEKYSISDGHLKYDDKSMDLYVEAVDLNHSGSGNFTADVYDLDTRTSIAALTTSFAGIAYLTKVKTSLDAVLNADMKNMKFTLKDNDLQLNALKIGTDGWVQLKEEDIDMDLAFNAPSNNFRDLLSLIPGAYIQGYEGVKANGNFSFDATVKGTYNGEKEVMPAFTFNLKVDGADVKYPDLPVGISGIFAQIGVNSPSSDLNKMTVDIPRFAMKVGEHPFEGNFHLKTPISDPDVDAALKGVIHLEQLARAFPMEGVEKISGIISTDMAMKARMSDIENARYSNVQAKGFLKIDNMIYDAVDMPLVNIKALDMDLTPQRLSINSFDSKLGKSDLQASGTVDNLLAWFSPEKTMKGDLKVTSALFDANEWMEESTAEAEPAPAPQAPAEETEVFDRFDFSLDGRFDIIKYDVYTLYNTIVKGSFSPERLSIDNFSTKLGNSDIAATGLITNVFDYVFDNETLTGKINLSGNLLDLNEFMGEETAPAGTQTTSSGGETAASEPVLVPSHIDMEVNTNIGRVVYTDIELKNVRGAVVIRDEVASLKNVTADIFNGSMAISGGYNTQNHEKPAFDLKYDINRIHFQKAFNTFNTFSKLAPIAKYMDGTFTTSLNMTGTLNKDLTPDISSLTADGFLETINGIISNFAPLEKVGNLLNINEFKNMEVKDVKTWFEVKDGRVEVKEFPYKFQNIGMTVGGSHGLDQTMDYSIKAQIPRKLFDKNSVTAAANNGLNMLNKEASKLGLNLNAGEFVNVAVKMTGSITDPKVGIKLLGTDGKPLNVVEEVKEQVKEKVEEKVEEVKQQVTEEIDKQKEDLRKKAEAEIAAVMQKAEATAQKIRDEGTRLAEEAKKLGYEQADKLEKEAGSNPLKKIAAKKGADALRKEADQKAEKIKKEADQNADKVMNEARQQAEGIKQKYGI